MARPRSPFPNHTPPLGDWFIVRITAVIAGSPQSYEAEEWWSENVTDGDPLGTGPWKVKTGGRQITEDNPGIAVPANGTAAAGDLDEITFKVGDFAFARSADGAGGLTFELTPISQPDGIYARLTETDGVGWKWQPLTLVEGVWTAGNESDDYTAIQLPQTDFEYPTGTPTVFDTTPQVGQRVWLTPQPDGYHGFIVPLPSAVHVTCPVLLQQIDLGNSCTLFTFDLPAAGTYLLYGRISALVYSSGGLVALNMALGESPSISTGLGKFVASAYKSPDVTSAYTSAGAGSGYMQYPLTVTGPTTISLVAACGTPDGSGTAGGYALIVNNDAGYIPLSSKEDVVTTCLDCEGGSGSGSGGSPGDQEVTLVGSGTATGVAGSTITVTIPDVTLEEDDELVVVIGLGQDGAIGGGGTSVTWGAESFASFGTKSTVNGYGNARLLGTGGVTGTNDVVVTNTSGGGNKSLFVAVLIVSNSANATETLASSRNNGTSGAPDAGAGSPTTGDRRAAISVALMNDSSMPADGTWSNGFASEDTLSSTTGGNWKFQVGSNVQSLAGYTFHPALTGTSATQWSCVNGNVVGA